MNPVPLSFGRGGFLERPESEQHAARQGEPSLRGHGRTVQSRIGRLLTAEGIRGVYRNELDLPTAERFATALAAMLWEDVEVEGRRPPAKGFPVVIGYDDRPWSLPIAVAAGRALRRSGCETIDVGLATGPMFRFATSHLEAAAGLLVTGSGCGPASTGIDFALAGGRPLSSGATLDRLAQIASRDENRLTRRGGGHRSFDVAVPYEASFWRHFQSRGSTSAIIGSSSPLVLDRINRIGLETGTTLRTLPLARQGKLADVSLAASVAALVRESRSAFGLWIDENGTACRAIDETGAAVPTDKLAALLLSQTLEERPTATVAVDWALGDRLAGGVLRRREFARGRGSAEAMFESMKDHAAVAGADSAGRFWLPGPPPTSDAVITFARLLQCLSAGDMPLSQRVKVAAS